ncbi:Ctr copper transporter [Ilyonectria robusta]|uniref:Ctr copper transporter n=1 Tax=Ilyonectria robusta TaxID=1079257 RepID=UPI001E8E861D|nr:Ctr copper transporter [Ilyonectria robusta]KAH8654668.1 Ctr copper transporter [Ilyonectria robusta]
MPIFVDNYAGTCLFLIVLGVIARSLVAVKSVLERRWIDADLNSRYVVVKTNPNNDVSSDAESSKGILTENGIEKDVMVVRRHMKGAPTWRITIDGPRAAIDTAIAGVLYLIMLSIMPMNVGYFLAVLGGIFLGSLAFGRFGGLTLGDATQHA